MTANAAATYRSNLGRPPGKCQNGQSQPLILLAVGEKSVAFPRYTGRVQVHPQLHPARRIVPCIIVHQISHKRTLILIQRLAFFLCLKSLAPQDFFHLAGCMVGAFPLFFGCKRRLMLVSPYSEVQVGCIIKRLLVVEPVAVLYWVHMTVPEKTRYRRTGC